MPRRSPARYLAPLAIVAFLLALMVVVTPSGDGGDGSPAASATAEPAATPDPASERSGEPERPARRTYRVRPGDTPSTIAERTGVPLEQLEALNPDIDPQQLAPGQRLRLRR
ncbi:MAG: hypothetical protein AVDCRST_MAG69-1587 [uncultured Solirubrobacteraceae bacterium]|uniref:LysM domain-containing protein n=1 Tax=uncultured Solirubrobacteraceae bacterium TaxID=1162706 RepID=A0A6J4SCP9_9ACTN|nr:MAG: hypothetical protein AVDCRST_MAG69-1587 [uncultured Solirubrobacteraceae bacterium]